MKINKIICDKCKEEYSDYDSKIKLNYLIDIFKTDEYDFCSIKCCIKFLNDLEEKEVK